ncbi:hypothetical protein ACHAQE_007573 [Botrytis cinerea]
MNEDSSKNHRSSILEQAPAAQLPLERYKCHEIPKLLDCLCLQLELLEMMNKSNVLMIWRDEFNVIINVLNEKAIAAFHEKYSSLQAAAKSTLVNSQSLNHSRASKKGSGLRISEIIDLTLETNEDCTEIGVGNTNEYPSSSVNYFISHDLAQNTTTTSPSWDIQDFNNSSITRGMGEKQAFNRSGIIDPGLAVQYAENPMETCIPPIPFSTPASYITPQEISLEPISSSETVPSPTRSRKRGDPHQCDVCSKTFTRGTTLREHARRHTNEKPYKCTTCEKGFSRRKDCRRHELLHKNARKFCCNFEACYQLFFGTEEPFGCGRSFTRMDALKAHWNSVRGADCLKAAFESIKRDLLDCHHFKRGCLCDSSFETVDDLKAHLSVPFQTSCLRKEVMKRLKFIMMDQYSESDSGQE